MTKNLTEALHTEEFSPIKHVWIFSNLLVLFEVRKASKQIFFALIKTISDSRLSDCRWEFNETDLKYLKMIIVGDIDVIDIFLPVQQWLILNQACRSCVVTEKQHCFRIISMFEDFCVSLEN